MDTQPVSSPQNFIGKSIHTVADTGKKVLHAIDEYTSPRESTAGNFEKPSYFQACVQAGVEGFYMEGPIGIVAGALSSAAGVFGEDKTGSFKKGILAGCATGVALQVGLGLLAGAGPAGLATRALTGGLMGLFFTMRGNQSSDTRDSAGNANMITACVVHGPAKLAGGIGAALATKVESKPAKALVGAATSAAIGAGLAAIGFSPVGIVTATIISGLAGGLGPFVGPRFSQLFRNLSNDLGKGLNKLFDVCGKESKTEEGKEKRTRFANCVGSLPSSFVKEGVRGFFLSDGGLSGFVVGGIMETIQQAQIFLCSKMEKNLPEGYEDADEAQTKQAQK